MKTCSFRDRSMFLFTFLLLISASLVPTVFAQKVTNVFFPLHNIIRGDSAYNTFDKQVELIKTAGYDALEINQIESFEGMKAALDKHHFKGAYFYVKLNVDEPIMDPRLQGYIAQLKGSGVVIAPFVVSDSKRYNAPSEEADQVAEMVTQIGKWAAGSGLQVAFYPHYKFYVETLDHAFALVKKINQPNVGMAFNLCHWLATSDAQKRKTIRQELKTFSPHLKLVTISGANDVVTTKKSPWEDYILPLGTGSFDTYGLLRYIVRDLHYKGPIGAQCYDIKGSKPELVRTTISAWRNYKTRLEAGK